MVNKKQSPASVKARICPFCKQKVNEPGKAELTDVGLVVTIQQLAECKTCNAILYIPATIWHKCEGEVNFIKSRAHIRFAPEGKHIIFELDDGSPDCPKCGKKYDDTADLHFEDKQIKDSVLKTKLTKLLLKK